MNTIKDINDFLIDIDPIIKESILNTAKFQQEDSDEPYLEWDFRKGILICDEDVVEEFCEGSDTDLVRYHFSDNLDKSNSKFFEIITEHFIVLWANSKS